jgi:hypothetical protein
MFCFSTVSRLYVDAFPHCSRAMLRLLRAIWTRSRPPWRYPLSHKCGAAASFARVLWRLSQSQKRNRIEGNRGAVCVTDVGQGGGAQKWLLLLCKPVGPAQGR